MTTPHQHRSTPHQPLQRNLHEQASDAAFIHFFLHEIPPPEQGSGLYAVNNTAGEEALNTPYHYAGLPSLSLWRTRTHGLSDTRIIFNHPASLSSETIFRQDHLPPAHQTMVRNDLSIVISSRILFKGITHNLYT
jgi:hypothetical protein